MSAPDSNLPDNSTAFAVECDALFGGRVRDIRVCHLPYQSGPFVVGTIDNPESPAGQSNVWLRRDGSWSDLDGDPECTLNMGDWDAPAGASAERFSAGRADNNLNRRKR